MANQHPIHDRHLGVYPVSLGTSIALQGVLGELTQDEDIPSPYTTYDLLAVNVRTLLRNLLGSVNSKVDYVEFMGQLTQLAIEEMLLIHRIIKDRTQGKLKVMFYTGMYFNRHTLFPFMKNIKELTKKQNEHHVLECELMGSLGYELKRDTRAKEFKWVWSDKEPPVLSNNPFAKMVLLTHLPTDILFVGNASVAILESHTGNIKTQAQFNTKLKGKPEHLPFNKITVQVMGDTGGIVSPSHIKDRKLLQALAEQKGWSPMTTLEQVKLDIQTDNNPLLVPYTY